jgi:hypothetical protein
VGFGGNSLGDALSVVISVKQSKVVLHVMVRIFQVVAAPILVSEAL